jgi:hypothetical protein
MKMKLAIAGAFWALLTTAAPPSRAQDQAARLSEVKHLTVFPVNGIRPVLLSALSIQRGAEYPSVVELRGDVEIRTRLCVMQGDTAARKGAMVCDGEMVVRADDAVFHEDTGTVEATGKVTFSTVPYPHPSQ